MEMGITTASPCFEVQLVEAYLPYRKFTSDFLSTMALNCQNLSAQTKRHPLILP